MIPVDRPKILVFQEQQNLENAEARLRARLATVIRSAKRECLDSLNVIWKLQIKLSLETPRHFGPELHDLTRTSKFEAAR